MKNIAAAQSKSWALRIPCGDVTLSGDLEIPPNAVGLVLFAHGSGSSRFSRRNRAVAGVLRASGVGTLLFDLLTEDEEAAEAYTRHLRFDIGLLTRRLVTVTEEMADDPRVRGRPWILRFQHRRRGRTAGSSCPWIEDQSGRFPRRSPGSCRRCITLREGGDAADRRRAGHEEVLRLNETAYEQLNCEKALAVVPHATHLFEEPGALEEVARLAAEWFAKHLKLQL